MEEDGAVQDSVVMGDVHTGDVHHNTNVMNVDNSTKIDLPSLDEVARATPQNLEEIRTCKERR